MATVVQVIQLYRRILDYLMPLEKGIPGWGENRFLGNGKDFNSAYSRSDDINGRFFYTGLGSGQQLGGFVHVESEKIRGGWNSRSVGGVRGVLGVGGVNGVEGVRGVFGVGNMRSAADGVSSMNGVGGLRNTRDIRGVGGMRNARSNWSAWNVGNNWNRGMESTSRALAGVNTANAMNALNTLNAISTANAAGKQNALGYRLGEDLEKQLNGKQILGTDFLAPIDRSLEITGRGFSVMGRIREFWGDLNGFSQKIKTGGTLRTQSAVSEKKRAGELGRLRNAVSPKMADTIGGFGENAERLTAIRGFVERESGGTVGLGASGGCDADELIDKLCGAFREAAFSMSEGVHY